MSVGSTSMVLAIARPVLYTGAAVISGAAVGLTAKIGKKVFNIIQNKWPTYDLSTKMKTGIVITGTALAVGYVFLASSLALKVVMIVSAVLTACYVKVNIRKINPNSSSSSSPIEKPQATSQTGRVNWDEVLRQINLSQCEAIATEEDLVEQALHEIVPGLFLGGSYRPEKIVTIKNENLPVDTVINNTIGLTNERTSVNQLDNIQNLNFNLGFDTFKNEKEKEEFVYFAAHAFKLMDDALARDENVLVYCQQGKDRSSALLALYLYVKTNEKAEPLYIYNFIQSQRPIAEFALDEVHSYFTKMLNLLPEIKEQRARF